MLNAERPNWELSCPRSASSCSTSAVEDIDEAEADDERGLPGLLETEIAAAPMPTVVTSTCAEPKPKIDLRSTHSREGCSSRPMTNIRSTMPNSAMCWVVSTLADQPQAGGTDDDAGREVAEHRAQLEVSEYRDRDDRRGEKYSDLRQQAHTISPCVRREPSIMYRQSIQFPVKDAGAARGRACARRP